MGRITKITLTLGVLTAFVVGISLAASFLINPNQNAPIKYLVPLVEDSNPVTYPSEYTIGAWVWEYPTKIQNVQTLVDFASEQNIDTLYLYIDEYVDIYEMPDSPQKNLAMANYNTAIKSMLTAAKQKNIQVHALAGNTNYSYDSHEYIPPLIVRHIYDFNKANPDTPFTGLQFDVEFYEDPRFYGSPKEYITSYLKFVADTAKLVKEENKKTTQPLRLGIVIPFWFDEANQYLDAPILDSVIKELSTLSNPYLVVMAYRNQVDGDKGVLAISQTELEKTIGTPVKVLIAQELAKNQDEKITHYGKSRNQIKTDLLAIIEKSKPYPNFEGISIHDLAAFIETR